MRLTDFGISTLVSMAPPKDNSEAHQHLRGLIKKVKHSDKMDHCFQALEDGVIHSREEVAVAAGYPDASSSGFRKVISGLSGLGMIQYPSKDSVQLADIAFPYGRGAPVRLTVKDESNGRGVAVWL